MREKTHIDGADTESTATTTATLQTSQTDEDSAAAGVDGTTGEAAAAAALQSLQTKLSLLQAKLHKEFRWYCDTILQGGALAIRVAYRVHLASEVLTMVDDGEVRDDPALGEPMCCIGTSMYTESDIDTLLTVEYLLDDLYDAWCSMNHNKEEWSDTVDRCLDITEGRYRYHNNK